MGTEIKVATYRVQVHGEFTLEQCAAICDYLGELGVSHLYTSPILKAVPGTTHGYDVVDFDEVNPELGGEAGLRTLREKMKSAGLGHLLDIVPNHMGMHASNLWWNDVLENGRSSRFASFFDIDWHSHRIGLRDKVLLPVLSRHYAQLLEAGKFMLQYSDGGFGLNCEEASLPVSPESVQRIIESAAERCGDAELRAAADALALLPSHCEGHQARELRHRVKTMALNIVSRRYNENPPSREAIEQVIDKTNHDPKAMDDLLEDQYYRLAFWRSADSELNYRRFFNINVLVALRAEREEVFRPSHRRILDWTREGLVQGLRVDHIDGLREPEQYLRRLHEESGIKWILVEKILAHEEEIPEAWPVSGTTGYEFMRLLNGLFLDPAGEQPLTEFYERFTGEPADFAFVSRQGKRHVLEGFRADLSRLTRIFSRICRLRRQYRDYTFDEMRRAVAAVVVAYPVYRTYTQPEEGKVSKQDTRYIEWTISDAMEQKPEIDPALFKMIGDLLLLRTTGDLEAEFVERVQQFTGAVMAKGVEDTAFYRMNRLVSLNEVGSDPRHFAVAPGEFHAGMEKAKRLHPLGLLATSTHDTKRGADVRARINLLSEIPQQWMDVVVRWSGINAKHRTGDWPDHNFEYAFYQTIFGAWPITLERLKAFAHKAIHEAKQYTGWAAPSAEYDNAVRQFVEKSVTDEEFITDLEAFLAPLVLPARTNSLAQTLLQLTAPGVPDIYQGSEIWDNSLVDPDNRRPVDYELRRGLMAKMHKLNVDEVMAHMDDGLPKLWLINKTLLLRREYSALFGPEATYRALSAQGPKSAHAVAFARSERVVAIAPRLLLGLAGDWGKTELELPFARWRNVLTGDEGNGRRITISETLKRFPVALLLDTGEGTT